MIMLMGCLKCSSRPIFVIVMLISEGRCATRFWNWLWPMLRSVRDPFLELVTAYLKVGARPVFGTGNGISEGRCATRFWN